MKNPLDYTPVLRHELRWGLRARLWILPLAVAIFALAFTKALNRILIGITFWIIVIYAMVSLAYHFVSVRRQPGLDPALDSAYPRWRIVLEQSVTLWLWELPVLLPAAIWGALLCSYPQKTWSFNGLNFAAFLLSFWCVGQIMLFVAAAGDAKKKGSLLLIVFLLYPLTFLFTPEWERRPGSLFTFLLFIGIVAVLAMLAHGAALMPSGANRALLLRPAALIAAALIAVFRPGVGTDALAVAGCLILIAAAGERWLPSRRQLAFVNRHPALKRPLFPFQSGFLPGLFTGAVVLGLTLKAEYWRRDIWFPLAMIALLLSLLPLLLLLSDSIPERYAQIALPSVTGAALIALAPPAFAYLKRYFRGDEDGDTL